MKEYVLSKLGIKIYNIFCYLTCCELEGTWYFLKKEESILQLADVLKSLLVDYYYESPNDLFNLNNSHFIPHFCEILEVETPDSEMHK